MKMSKEASKLIDSLAADAGKAYSELEAAIVTYNDALAALQEPLNVAVKNFNATQGALREAIEAERDQFQGEFDDKSEGWQEGDRGQAASAFIDSLDETLSELEDVEVEFPEPIEVNANNPQELADQMARESDQ